MNDRRFVYIEWLDNSCHHGWHDADGEFGPMQIESVGWIVKEDKQTIVISTSWTENDCVTEPLTILRACIERMDEFTLPWVKGK
jgi:hypothetical protein